MKLSIVIPAHNEEGSIASTVKAVSDQLQRTEIDHEIIVVDGNSTDGTGEEVTGLIERNSDLRLVKNDPPNGFGFAVRKGLESVKGEAVVVVMADASDDPEDIVTNYRKLEEGYDCVFGSRFIKGSKVSNYPYHKLLLKGQAVMSSDCSLVITVPS